MKHIFLYLLVALLCSTLLLNCNCGHVCNSPVPVLTFIDFDSTALHTVIVKEYNNDGQFNHLHHTTVYTSMTFTSGHVPGVDTMSLDSTGIVLGYFTDYTIQLPAVNRLWYLKGLSVSPAKMKAQSCINGVQYYLNDTLYEIPSSSSGSSSAQIVLQN